MEKEPENKFWALVTKMWGHTHRSIIFIPEDLRWLNWLNLQEIVWSKTRTASFVKAWDENMWGPAFNSHYNILANLSNLKDSIKQN